jgi:hypothetical protein
LWFKLRSCVPPIFGMTLTKVIRSQKVQVRYHSFLVRINVHCLTNSLVLTAGATKPSRVSQPSGLHVPTQSPNQSTSSSSPATINNIQHHSSIQRTEETDLETPFPLLSLDTPSQILDQAALSQQATARSTFVEMTPRNFPRTITDDGVHQFFYFSLTNLIEGNNVFCCWFFFFFPFRSQVCELLQLCFHN